MKVYISSTYQDLIEYRAAVDRTLRKMGHYVIGMEQYVAEGSKPVDKCKEDVGSVDVYVIIVAWRFGYVPDPKVMPPHPRSITEIELAEANRRGKPILAFLLDPKAPWPPDRIDAMKSEPNAGADISRLRTKLGSDYLAGIFRTPNDLASQVAAAVSAQGLTQQMVDRVLSETSAAKNMGAFAQGQYVEDSTLGSIKEMIVRSGNLRALVLPIDEGKLWWSTRLFLLASLLRALTSVRQVVFCDGDERFVGMASPGAILDGITSSCPELAEVSRRLREEPSSQDVERETDRQVRLWNQVFGRAVPIKGRNKPSAQRDERAVKVGVRASLLQQWLGERWVSRCIQSKSYDLNMVQVQQIVDFMLPDVPLQRARKPEKKLENVKADGRRDANVAVEKNKFMLQVVDRDAFALELAREWVRSGLPRTPVI